MDFSLNLHFRVFWKPRFLLMLGGLQKRALHFFDVLVFSENPNLSKQMNKISLFLQKKTQKRPGTFWFWPKIGRPKSATF